VENCGREGGGKGGRLEGRVSERGRDNQLRGGINQQKDGIAPGRNQDIGSMKKDGAGGEISSRRISHTFRRKVSGRLLDYGVKQ